MLGNCFQRLPTFGVIPLARQGDPLPVYVEETDKAFTIAWLGTYRIEGQAFLYSEQNSGRVRTILGYPIRHIMVACREALISIARATENPSDASRGMSRA